MNADDFWSNQTMKNQTMKNEDGVPKYKISTDAGTPEDEWMSAWIDKWHDRFAYFDNAGCGCCVNFYEFDAPAEAIAEIPRELLESSQ